MKYQFYIKMDNKAYGPYNLDEYFELNVPGDTEVMEASVGDWLPASYYPTYEELKARENGYIIKNDGTIQKVYEQENKENISKTLNTQYYNVNSRQEEREVPTKDWNWGAFFLNWIWGIFNGVYWPLIGIVCAFIPYIGPIINLGICIALGIYGNEWAWEAKSWESVEKFNRVQRNWSKASLYYIIFCIVIGLILVLVAMSNN